MRPLTSYQRDLLAVCALRSDDASVDWHVLARTCQSPEGLEAVLGGDIPEDSTAAKKAQTVLRQALPGLDDARERAEKEIAAAEKAGADLVTVLDPDYPANLRLVPNLPPFLFYLGALSEKDARSAAVVGTRGATELGLKRAARMARGLVENDVVVFSGLAFGL